MDIWIEDTNAEIENVQVSFLHINHLIENKKTVGRESKRGLASASKQTTEEVSRKGGEASHGGGRKSSGGGRSSGR